MERGQKVLVKAYPDKQLERIVLEETETYIVVCRPEVYTAISKSEGLPECAMGFPKEDVIGLVE